MMAHIGTTIDDSSVVSDFRHARPTLLGRKGRKNPINEPAIRKDRVDAVCPIP